MTAVELKNWMEQLIKAHGGDFDVYTDGHLVKCVTYDEATDMIEIK